ncbi:MAG: phosphoribosylformylglycinamidine cyclo-ligase [Candidatus Diapherotrites archaeon]
MKKQATYKDAGVDIDAGNLAVEKIKKHVNSTFTKDVLLGVGSFGGAISAEKLMKFKEPVLIASVDGVGTKLKIAAMMNKWDTVGIDIVNHCANDILCQGAEPFYFLDYIASSKISPDQIEQIVKGMSKACKKLGIPLLGGETAEMPGIYEKNETDIVGAITGIADKNKMISGKNIKENDVLIGIASDGLHTNGYSLARKIFFKMQNKNVNDFIDELDSTVGEALLIPHREYVNTVISLMNKFEIKGIAHITGGGLIENPKRVLPKGLGIEIEKNSWNVPAIFKYMQKKGNVPEVDMYRAFNMGIGLVLFVSKKDTNDIMNKLQKLNEKAFVIGKVVKGSSVTLK